MITHTSKPVLQMQVMMYAACFEEHYQGSDPDDPNYSEIYRWVKLKILWRDLNSWQSLDRLSVS